MTLIELANGINQSGLHDLVVNWLRNVPGLPPIVQTFHIVAIGCVMASIVMIDLRVLGLAVPSQTPSEMVARLMPWLWGALAVLFVSGAMFVIARPRRYFVNPVFGIKFALLGCAIVLSLLLVRFVRRDAHGMAKLCAVLSLACWIAVVLAGRWIAYADYLFPPE